MLLRMYLEYVIVFHQSKICRNNKNLRTLTVILVCRFYCALHEDLSRMNKKKKMKKNSRGFQKVYQYNQNGKTIRYVLIEISALFFSKTSMLYIFSAFFRRFISVYKSQEILPRDGINVILNNAVLIHAPASAGYSPAQTVNA